MNELLYGAAGLLLLTVAASLVRVLRGPTRADRMMGAQLSATAGVAVLMLLAQAQALPAVLDVALVLALLAALATVAFVKAASRDGAGDPEEEAP
ncbi:monovalent cation/H+ antiporter complex subunit F [Ramlibacter rhizophilus]|uniref:monovalent cation/H+ antiporter complex subunit F n=1 Tax=Ramlibacter rhizophilus TaxID=1781167 RepID=UPI0019816784|nr:monovalent cation/H+ antiporter complex subunit F [Ramlibacter rhizophilus]